MPLTLTTYQGSGTTKDPFRPTGIDGMVDYGSLDMRPDPTKQTGFCFVWHDTDVPKGALRTLGDRPADGLTTAGRNAISNRLGMNLGSDKLEDIMGEIFVQRLNAIRAPENGGRFEVWCGKLWWSTPQIAGGSALATDNFNRADANPINGNWTGFTSETNFQITSNTAAVGNGLSDNGCYENSATWPNDQYSQAEATVNTSFNDGSGIGVRVRMATGARTAYDSIVDASNHAFHSKFVSGTYTNIWSRAITFSAGAVIYLEVQGTTLVTKYNGSAVGASNTDSSIASGKAGLRHSGNTDSLSHLDNWEGGDFGGGGGVTVKPLAALGVG